MSSVADKLITIAENQQKVFEAGKKSGGGGGGYDEGYQDGYNDGEIDGWNSGYESGYESGHVGGYQYSQQEFWDAYQQSGSRTDYTMAFAGNGWNAETFRPKYDMQPTALNTAFYGFNGQSRSNTIDLVAALEECNVTLDTSKCTNFASTFMSSSITRVGTIDMTKATGTVSGTFYAQMLVTIEKWIVPEGLAFGSNFFQMAYDLENVVVEGTIGSALDMHWSSKLSKASIKSVINALSSTASGKTLSLSKTAVTNAFGSTTAAEWTALVGTKSNWTITLV